MFLTDKIKCFVKLSRLCYPSSRFLFKPNERKSLREVLPFYLKKKTNEGETEIPKRRQQSNILKHHNNLFRSLENKSRGLFRNQSNIFEFLKKKFTTDSSSLFSQKSHHISLTGTSIRFLYQV